MNDQTGPDPYAQRRAVGQWLRVKAANPHGQAQQVALHALTAHGSQAMYEQLAADAEHSDLLVRLLRGEQPR